MGFVYHANYLIWMDRARTEHLRERGVSYKQLEEQGTYLTVTAVHVRYRQPARYDDMIRVRCWVRDLASRRVIFGYAVERASTDARRFDPAALREALASNNPAVRRQAALAGGRMGDATAVDLLVPALSDSAPSVAAAAAFGLGLLKDARAIPALLQTIRAIAPADQGPLQLEAVTAIAKIGGEDGARALIQILTAASPTAPTAVADAALLEAL